ncbi:MAG TPA: Ig-like domain-containing protein [Pyrinomonadaceae bacterium]|nr:Ig-like domain-containing protein [Pyrinomonadaceae bacterium]
MKTSFPRPQNVRVFTAILVSYLMLVAPAAPLVSATARVAADTKPTSSADGTRRLGASEPGALDPPAAIISATKTDSFPDPDGDGKAEPGQTITYDVNVSNAGASDATGVQFNDTVDPATTLVPGSLRVSPLAFADSYNATKGVALSVPAPGVLANDTGTPSPTAQPIAAGATTQGGTVTLNADGSFAYTPPAGFEGADTFTYTATNGQTPNDTATVTINVDAAPTVASTSPTNGATSVAPNSNITINFSEPVNATTNSFSIQCPTGSPQSFTLSASPSASFTLDPTADLPAGQTCTVTVIANQITDSDNFDPPDQMVADYIFSFGVKPLAVDDMRSATGNVRIDSSNSGYSVLANDQAPGAVITSFDSTSVHGGNVTMDTVTGTFTYDPPRGFTGSDSFNYTLSNAAGSDQGTVVITVSDMIWFINNAAGACSVGCDGRLTHPFTSLAAFEAENGNGTTSLGVVIDPEAGDNIFLYSGSGSYTGPLTLENNQRVIGQGAVSSIAALAGITPAPDSDPLPPTGGTNPSVTTTAPATNGINLAQNDSIHGLSVVNTTGRGISGNGFGTLTVSENVVLSNTTTAGTPINLNNGALNATFKSISAGNNNASPDPANAIVLTNTTGSFTVDGDGTDTSKGGNASGGTIQHTAGADGTTDGIGVYLNGATNVTLRRMQINDNPNYAVRGKNVNGFTLEYSTVNGNNGTSATADNEVGIGAGEDSVRFTNLTGSALVNQSVIAGGFADNLRVVNNTGTLDRLTVSNSTVGDPDGAGPQRGLATAAQGGNSDVLFVAEDGIATMNVTLSNNTLNYGVGDVVRVVNNDNVGTVGQMDVVVRGNSMVNSNPQSGQAGGASILTVAGLGNVTYEIACNKTANSSGIGINVFKAHNTLGTNPGNFTGTIFDNAIGIGGQVGSGAGSGSSALSVDQQGTGTGTVLIKNNVIRRYGEAGIRLDNVDDLGSNTTLNATVIGNTVTEPDDVAFAGVFVNAGADPSTDSNSITNLKLGGGPGERNDFSQGDPFDFNDIFLNTPFGQFNLTQGVSSSTDPTQVSIDNNSPPDTTSFADSGIAVVSTTPVLPPAIDESCTPPLALLGVAPSGRGELAQASDATRTVAASSAATTDAGDTAIARVHYTDRFNVADAVQVASLDDAAKYAIGNRSRAAHAKFSGPRATTASFNATASADAAPSQGSTARNAHDATLLAPSVASLAPHAATLAQPFSGETVNASIGTLRAGKTVHITFQVTVNNPFGGTDHVSNQGTVSGDNFSPVVTDDPSVGGSSDPTVTPVLTAPNITVKDASVAEPQTGSSPAAFAVTLSHAYTHTVTVNFATADDTGGAHPATAGSDYTPTTGTLTFNPGETVQTVSVPVLADADNTETNETFLVNISGASVGTITRAQATGTITPNGTPGTVIISELRTSGPAGPDDEFVELQNNTDADITVSAPDSSGGWALVKSASGCGTTPVVVAVIPAGTVIPARGNYLLTGAAYSLSAYAAGDQTLVFGIEDDRNVALFNTADLSNISTAARLDAVGFGSNTGGNCDLLREGGTLPNASGSTSEYSFVRKVEKGATQDTGDNSADFIVVSTTTAPVGSNTPTLGAPGPENSTGARGPVPCSEPPGATKFQRSRLDSTQDAATAPNLVRDNTSNPANNSTFGTIDFRRRFTNNTGGSVTRLRFRITNTINPATAGAADLRALTSSAIVVSGVNDAATCGGSAPCSVAVEGTTLEQPPAQSNGGGVNSSLGVGTITFATPLASGASVDLHLLFGVQQQGNYHLSIVVEDATAGQIGQDIWELRGNTLTGGDTDGGCNTPPVASAGPDQTIECGGGSTSVTLDGSASSDPDGDTPLTYEWREGATLLGTGATLNTSLPFGPHTITLKVTDPSGDFGTDTVNVNIVDTTDPMITAPPNVTVNTGPGATSCGVVVSNAQLGNATASDGCSSSVTVTRTGVSAGNNFPVGQTIVTYTANDGHGHTKSAFQTVTVIDNTPPIISVPANIVVNAPANSCSANVNPGTATANDNCSGVTVTGTRSDNQPLNAPYPVGTTTITWKATDAANNTTTGTQTVTVKDVTPPVITLTSGAISLSPPNHSYHTFTIANFVASVSDHCDASVDINDVVISQVTSDEADTGGGSGNTTHDIVIAPDCKSVQLRSERDGTGDGRVYTITLKVRDSGGNVTTATRQVFVPKGSGPAVDSGAHYTVNGCSP